MPALLTTDWFLTHYGDRLRTTLAKADRGWRTLRLPAGAGRLDGPDVDSITIAFFHGDFRSDPAFTRRFFGTCLRAPNLAWVHLPNSGVDDPVFARLQANGVCLTNSPGAAAEPIAQTAIAAVLMLSRGFPRWLDAQRRRQWEPHDWQTAPEDLRGQRMVIVGVGAIGQRIAALASALGFDTIGIRRGAGPLPPGVNEIRTPGELATVVADADWLVLACPLTQETRGLVGEDLLARVKPGARLINVSRGEVVDERSLVAALNARRLGGAYLDVFEREPLAAESPLWGLPNVLLSPHDSAASRGNAHRVSEIFLRNLEHWLRGETLDNQVGPLPAIPALPV